MENKDKTDNLRFFAAANSYCGFISYFDKVFPSKAFNRIYVLKGGPGTGKSSFMKKMSSNLKEKECNIEEIYCSSDPHSLDGVIAEKNGRRIAIIDGTAPHERDAVIPGAIDEIINLGDYWESSWLTLQKDRILKLVNNKGNAYKTAYSYLCIAGKADKFIYESIGMIFDKTEAKNKAEELFKDIPQETGGTITTRLIDSFGRHGEHRLDTLKRNSKSKIGVSGSSASISHFMNICADVLKQRGLSFVHFPLALDPTSTDAIFSPYKNLAIIRDEISDINADDFLINPELTKECIKRSQAIKKDALEEAQRWFAVASEIHFELEEIYGKAMDFNKNDLIFKAKLTEIDNILEL